MSARPELGELTVDQNVMIVRSPNDMRRRKPEEKYIPAKVVKVARVWVTLKSNTGAWDQEVRMRLDTQDQDTQYSGSNQRFLTIEQYEWEQSRDWARQVLQENGLQIRDSRSPWYGREIELADLIVKSQGEGP